MYLFKACIVQAYFGVNMTRQMTVRGKRGQLTFTFLLEISKPTTILLNKSPKKGLGTKDMTNYSDKGNICIHSIVFL